MIYVEVQTVAPKETEFNSSVATLKRIDDLMRQLHDLSRGIIPTNKFGLPLITGNPYELYVSTIDRLYLEGHVKFDGPEKDKCKELDEARDTVKDKFGSDLKLKEISRGMPPYQYVNLKYYEGWEELLKTNKEYESYVVECLDKHGMLMKTKDSAEFALR